MRWLLIKGHSLYGGTRLFIDSATEALRKLGHECDVLDLAETADPRALLEASATVLKPDAIFSIGVLGEYREPSGRSLAEAFGAPHLLWHVDYLLGQFARLEQTPPQTRLLVVDPTQADAVRATYGEARHPDVRFFPHPAVGAPGPDDVDAAAFQAARPIPLLWCGGFQRPEDAWGNVPAELRRPLREAVDIALSEEWTPPHLAADQALRAHGVNTADPRERWKLKIASCVQDVVRSTRRTEFLKALAKAGLPVHICGEGWQRHLYRFKNATFEGPVEMTRMVELMRRSRVVLNTNANFGAGSHERVFSAALAGAAPFSDHSRYYDRAFAPGEIALFRWKDLPGAMANLRALVDDPERAFEIGRAAKARAVGHHTWDERLPLILEAAEAARIAA
ncbi:glycosyltransferase [Phenylobacterium kunshanense]|uniref:Spore protein YkvP/CgeB glycosyl transferase-like domain-containing protein n=1 Tax=Phenylobacterium kunshanense TaxID=1445034 RepID=A0A328BPA9_9CAUL|nr:glycosyltransferase [Phenylobacterium kunshanense]RAK68933.1 hypothetical protein DJ019_02660 [Phenylobacterium kunshanense]